jgi:CHASE2 domain-containing sensor protein
MLRLLGKKPPLIIFSNKFSQKSGVIDYNSDTDGVVRRFQTVINKVPQLAVAIANHVGKKMDLKAPKETSINYRGNTNVFPSLSFKDILENRYPNGYFQNKIIIIGAEDDSSRVLRTPLGDMSTVDWTAQLVDNLISDRTISKLSYFNSVFFLFILLMLCSWVMVCYPQTVALVFLIMISVTLSAFSMWIFDTYSFWTPLLAALAQIGFTYIAFLSFQLTQKENLTWRLEQQNIYVSEVEKLKNNFEDYVKNIISKHDNHKSEKNMQEDARGFLLNVIPVVLRINIYIVNIDTNERAR